MLKYKVKNKYYNEEKLEIYIKYLFIASVQFINPLITTGLYIVIFSVMPN